LNNVHVKRQSGAFAFLLLSTIQYDALYECFAARMNAWVTRVCEVFSGNDEAAVALARVRWKDYLAVGHTLSYWQQGERGWEKKANT